MQISGQDTYKIIETFIRRLYSEHFVGKGDAESFIKIDTDASYAALLSEYEKVSPHDTSRDGLFANYVSARIAENPTNPTVEQIKNRLSIRACGPYGPYN
jgi:hypothetical protein